MPEDRAVSRVLSVKRPDFVTILREAEKPTKLH